VSLGEDVLSLPRADRILTGWQAFMSRVTHLGGTVATILPGLALLALDGPERQVGVAVLAANAASHLVVQILKRLVARPRPCDAEGRPLAVVELPDPFSFPSGHAAAAAAVAGTLVQSYPFLAPLLLPVAVLVAASRVSLGVHHASDAVAGAILGLAAALLLFPLIV
jgi:undecaprenyl-diphosphatase